MHINRTKTDTGVYCSGGYRGHGRKGGGGGRGRGGGGGSSTFTPVINTAGQDAKVTKTYVKSNLDDAYRKKVKKLREQTRK